MIFGYYWVWALLGAALVGLWLGQPLLVLAALLGLLVGGAELLWTLRCLDGLEYERRLERTHALWGEGVVLTTRLANRKLLPLTWVRTEEGVPAQLPLEGGRLADRTAHGSTLRQLLPLLPYEQVVRRYTIRCTRRGLFEIGPGRVESGDLLGYASRGKVYPRVDHLVVYPKLFELEVGALAARRLVGRQATDRVILTDPSRTVGVRAFRPGDPLRYVEWRATARRSELLVRTFEPTTDLSLAIFLDFQPEADDAVLEFAISVAASVARWGLRRGYPVGMFGNGGRGETDVMRVPISASPNQLARMLEVLARAEPVARVPLGPLLVAEAARLSYEASVVLVTTGLDEPLLAALAEARRQHPVTLVHVQAPGAPAVRAPGLHVIGVPYDPEWERRERLRLAA